MELANKRVLVAGMARSGVAAAALLDSLGAHVTIYDQKTAGVLGEALAPLQGLPIEEALGVEPDSGKFDLVVTSPGIPLTAPVLKQAASSGRAGHWRVRAWRGAVPLPLCGHHRHERQEHHGHPAGRGL